MSNQTVAEILAVRDDCRYGLRGVRMQHLPTGREFECGGSAWDAKGKLLLFTREERMKAGYEGEVFGSLVVYDASKIMEGIEPYEPHEIVRAEDCILLSQWPVVCCKPKRRQPRKDLSNGQ